jgi:hypothetical protein
MTRRLQSVLILSPLVVCTLAVALHATPQDKVTLVRKAKVGDVTRTSTEGQLSMDMAGTAAQMGVKEVSKITVTAVAPDGNLTLKTESESMEMMVNGSVMPSPPPQPPVTVVVKADNSLVSHSTASQDGIEGRMFYATTPLFSDKPVAVGDTWTRTVKADATLGVMDGSSELKVLGFEKMNTADTVKLSMTYKETGTGATLTCKGTFWVDRATGDEVKSEYEVSGVPMMGMGMMSGTLKVNRIGG